MDAFENFIYVVKKYAEAYKSLEELQKNKKYDFIPTKGDQKTGLIGEAFMFEYLKRQGYVGLVFGNHSQEGWDIKYDFDMALNHEVLIQVKTVSAFSETKEISPIHFFDTVVYCEVYIISLDANMIPNGLWEVNEPHPNKIKINGGKQIVKGARLPKNENDYSSGFSVIKNCFEDFKEKFPEIYGKK